MPTITKEELRHLYGHLEQLRAEEPVLWAVVVGRSTAPKIAMVLAIPTGMVEKDLELLVKQKVLKRMSATVFGERPPLPSALPVRSFSRRNSSSTSGVRAYKRRGPRHGSRWRRTRLV